MKRTQPEGRAKPETVRVGNTMVRIYKRQRRTATGNQRTIFEVADNTAGARRLRGFTDHKAARREAEKIARQLATGDATAATMRNPDAASFGPRKGNPPANRRHAGTRRRRLCQGL